MLPLINKAIVPHKVVVVNSLYPLRKGVSFTGGASFHIERRGFHLLRCLTTCNSNRSIT